MDIKSIKISRKNLKSIKKIHIYNGIKKYSISKPNHDIVTSTVIVLYDIFQKNNA